MQMRRHFEVWVLAMALSTLTAAASSAQTIWAGPTLSFSKAAFADPTLPANQDAVLPGVVSITRGNSQGIYNPVTEASFTSGVSPADTEWAFPNNNPTETVEASNFAALTFNVWQSAHGGSPPSTVGQPGVMHIISADIYLDVMFTSWGAGGGSGGSFSYERATPSTVPGPGMLPVALGLGVTGTLALALRARRPRADRSRDS